MALTRAVRYIFMKGTMKSRLTCIVVGAGHRAVNYAASCPDLIEVVGVADPDTQRRERVA